MLDTLTLTPAQVTQAAQLLREGALVAFPTETVYGLGGVATHDQAVARIFEAKGRPTFNPLIVHVPDLAAAQAIASFTSEAMQLAKAFWPGALTLVLPLRPNVGISALVSAGLPTVAVRVPNHPLAQDLLRAVGAPVAAPSANPSGRISPTTAAHVQAGLGGRIAAILDGGSCTVGMESTIVGFDKGATLLRPGGIAAEDITAVLGKPLARHSEGINAPGQMASHYAPSVAIRLNARQPGPGESFLGFGAHPASANLSESGDLVEAAANLFAMLHMLDDLGAPIAVAPIPERGLGCAINDRLRRAAADRG